MCCGILYECKIVHVTCNLIVDAVSKKKHNKNKSKQLCIHLDTRTHKYWIIAFFFSSFIVSCYFNTTSAPLYFYLYKIYKNSFLYFRSFLHCCLSYLLFSSICLYSYSTRHLAMNMVSMHISSYCGLVTLLYL